MTTLKQLVTRFADNIDQYKHSSFNETQVSQEFINPFFDLMGWDVYNRDGYAATQNFLSSPQEMEVSHFFVIQTILRIQNLYVPYL
jgi:hypothetical protein